MKKYIAIVCLVFAFLPGLVLAESIQDFSASISVAQNASLQITERIVYDFGTAQHHGIYRDIPYNYKARGGNYDLRIGVLSITDEQGLPYKFTSNKSGGFLHIQIGDANTLVTGMRTYVIAYRVDKAINYFENHDELYWNVTGNGWNVPITRVSAQVNLPASAAGHVNVDCFAGPVGSTEKCSSKSAQGSSAVFEQASLPAGSGLTIVLSWPKGVVAAPSVWQKIFSVVLDNFGLFLPLLVLGILIYIWRTRGRDPEQSGVVVPQYEPLAELTPTQMGTVVDEKADNQDISAELIYLATKGYLKITKLNKKLLIFNTTDYQLDLLKDTIDLEPYERRLLEAVFGGKTSVKLSELKNVFYEDFKSVKNLVYDSVIAKGYFSKNPQTVRATYAGAGVLLFIGGIFLGVVTQNVFTIIGFVLSGILCAVFGFFMPKKTVKGTKAKEYILGFKQYLSVAEKDRLKFFNAPEKSPDRFEMLLPYAMVLGVEEAWAKQFEGLYNKPPAWYSDPTGAQFNSLFFVNSLHSFSMSTNSTFSSHARGGSSAWGGGSGFGGGFSGGGFGGGGGGSW